MLRSSDLKKFYLVSFLFIFQSCIANQNSQISNDDIKKLQKQIFENKSETINDKKKSQADYNIDRFEPINRFSTNLNRVLLHTYIDPITKTYENVAPNPLRRFISNFLDNLKMPYYAICSLLGGKFKNSAKCISNMFVNTAFGLGFIGVSKIQHEKTDLDNTFATWGIPGGSYIVVPLIGPTNIRGIFAKILSIFINPIYVLTRGIPKRDHYIISYTAIDVIDTNLGIYKQNQSLAETSSDYYAVVRSIFMQHSSMINIDDYDISSFHYSGLYDDEEEDDEDYDDDENDDDENENDENDDQD